MNNDRKIIHLKQLAEYRDKLHREPRLKNLFLELTLRCNENCLHCGSRCGDNQYTEQPPEVYYGFLDKIKKDFSGELPMLCITGGEPLLYKDFFSVMEYAHKLGFVWGMTSNGTLIDDALAKRLVQCGMATISISIDGLQKTHDEIRRTPGGYDAAVRGIRALVSNGGFQHIQVTTVVNKRNIGELDELYKIMLGLGIRSWRVINIEPIGRARENEDLLLTPEDYRYMFDFIKERRGGKMPVVYGCQHYLGLEYEREVRDWYYLCNAGIYTASIMSNGDIGACLDIERRAETIEGNILKDDFTDIWYNGFKYFRQNLSNLNDKCRACGSKEFCNGGSFHSWDYDNAEPLVCFKDILFK